MARVLSKNSVKSVINELEILKELSSEFIVNAQVAFQDREHLYLGLDLLRGGDLRFHIIKHRTFSEAQSKFMIACIVQGRADQGWRTSTRSTSCTETSSPKTSSSTPRVSCT